MKSHFGIRWPIFPRMPSQIELPLREGERSTSFRDLESSDIDHSYNPTNHEAESASNLRPITRRRQILVLISSFLTICITIGFNQAYGVFQSYYISPTQTMLPKSTTSDSALVAFIGTLGYGLTWGGSIIVNPIMARLGIRGNKGLGVLGVLCMSMGFGLASLSTQVSHETQCPGPVNNLRYSGLAPAPNTGTPVWNWLLTSLLSDLECSPGVFHRAPRLSDGLYTLWSGGGRTCVLSSDPLPPDLYRPTLDTADALIREPHRLTSHSSYSITITLYRTETHSHRPQTCHEACIPVQRWRLIPSSRW